MAGGDPRSPYAVEEGHTIWAFPPFFIFCSASVQQGTTPFSGNSAGSPRLIELSKTVQTITEDTGTEISPADLWATFQEQYLPMSPGVQLLSHEETTSSEEGSRVTAQLLVDGEHRTISGRGNGPIAAFVHAIQSDLGVELEVVDYAEHAVSAGTDATAVAYVEARGADVVTWGVGMDESINSASLKAVVSAFNRVRGRASRGIGGPACQPVVGQSSRAGR